MLTEQQLHQLLAALAKQTRALAEQTKALNKLAESNMALADAVLAGDGDPEDEEGHGTDMAGNPVRVS